MFGSVSEPVELLVAVVSKATKLNLSLDLKFPGTQVYMRAEKRGQQN